MVDLSYIEQVADMQALINQLQHTINRSMRPILTDNSLIPAMHDVMQQTLKGEHRGFSIRAEIIVFLYLYDPMRLYIDGGMTKNHYDFKHICDALGITRTNFSKYKKGLLLHYRLYAHFRDVVNKLVDDCIVLAMSKEVDV